MLSCQGNVSGGYPVQFMVQVDFAISLIAACARRYCQKGAFYLKKQSPNAHSFVMLLAEIFFKTFTSKKICDAAQQHSFEDLDGYLRDSCTWIASPKLRPARPIPERKKSFPRVSSPQAVGRRGH